MSIALHSLGHLAVQHDWDEVVREQSDGRQGQQQQEEQQPQHFVLTDGQTVMLQPQPPAPPEFWVSGHRGSTDLFGTLRVRRTEAGVEVLPKLAEPQLEQQEQDQELEEQKNMQDDDQHGEDSAAFSCQLLRLVPSPVFQLGCEAVFPGRMIRFQAPIRAIPDVFQPQPAEAAPDSKQPEPAVASSADAPVLGPLPDSDADEDQQEAALPQPEPQPVPAEAAEAAEDQKEAGRGDEDEEDDDEQMMSMSAQVDSGGNTAESQAAREAEDRLLDSVSLEQLEAELFPKKAGDRRHPGATGSTRTCVATCMDVRPDGRQALVGSTDGVLSLVDLEAGRPERLLWGAELRWESHLGDLSVVRYLPNPVLALSGGTDTLIKLWALDIHGCAITLQGVHQRAVSDLAVVGQGSHVVSASLDGTGCLWETGKAVAVTRFGIPGVHDRPGGAGLDGPFSQSPFEMRCCLLQDLGGGGAPMVFMGTDHGMVYGYDPRAGEQLRKGAGQETVMPVLQFNAGGPSSAGSQEQEQVSGSVNCLATLDGSRLVLGLEDGSTKLLDVRNGRSPLQLLGRNRNVPVSSLAVTEAGNGGGGGQAQQCVLVGSGLGDVSLWSQSGGSGDEGWSWERELTGADLDPVVGLRALADGSRVFSCSGTVIREYDL